MNTIIQSYFQIDDEFIPIEKFFGKLPDSRYIEGAIVCTINGRELIRLEHHDLVDQLWAYIINGLMELRNGNDFDIYFPDQALRLRLFAISQRCIEVTIGDETNKVDYDEFVATIKRGAIPFFEKMKEILPERSPTWDLYLGYLKMIPG